MPVTEPMIHRFGIGFGHNISTSNRGAVTDTTFCPGLTVVF